MFHCWRRESKQRKEENVNEFMGLDWGPERRCALTVVSIQTDAEISRELVYIAV